MTDLNSVDDGTVPRSENDLKDIGVIQDRRIYRNNLAYEEGTTMNANIGKVEARRGIDSRTYEGNSARNKAVVVNGDMDGDSFARFMGSRKWLKVEEEGNWTFREAREALMLW